MILTVREAPQGKPVSLFVTCMVDTLYPEVGISTVKILEHVGLEVDFPQRQTCCGQPGFNGGYWAEARRVADKWLAAFHDAEVIVAPSGSCVAMVRHEYQRLYADEPQKLRKAEKLAGVTWELTEFLVDGLGIRDLGARLPKPQTFAFHDSCHGLRQLKLGQQARTLVRNIEKASVIEMEGHEECCGFGGLFSIKMPDVSEAMLGRKMAHVKACPAQVLSLDVSCMANINGGLSKNGANQRVRHVAEIIAEALPDHREEVAP